MQYSRRKSVYLQNSLNATVNLCRSIKPKLNLFICLRKLKAIRNNVKKYHRLINVLNIDSVGWRLMRGAFSMPFLFFHLVAGMLAGTFFRVQTLFVVALLVLGESFCGLGTRGLFATILWALAAQAMLQFGYVAGVLVRSVLGRSDMAVRIAGGTRGPSAQRTAAK